MIRKLDNGMFVAWLFLVSLLWVLLWASPWTNLLESLPWIRLGMTLFMFSVPGVSISMILVGKRLTFLGHLIGGFILSVFVVGGLGLFGRIFHLPFAYIKPVFVVIGWVALVMLIKYSKTGYPLCKASAFSKKTVILLLGMAIFGVAVVLSGVPFQVDDFSYLAYLTSWQHAQPLDFREVIYGTGGLDSVRFWLAMFPMNLAFWAEVSDLHGLLLIGYYLEPFLLVTALLSLYNLYEDILPQGKDLPAAALLLQLTFLFILQRSRQPGIIFFSRLSEDKAFAAFVAAPVFFLAVRYLCESITFRSVLFTLLSGWSLALIHPVVLTYCIMIAGLYSFLLAAVQMNFMKFALVGILLGSIILPSALLRFAGVPWVAGNVFGVDSGYPSPIDFDLESVSYRSDTNVIISAVEGTPFYGFNLALLKIRANRKLQETMLSGFLSWSYLWLMGLGSLWAIFNIKKSDAAVFVFSASVLFLLCAIPYTGWLVGYFVHPRMLWRSPWLFPIGLVGAILINELLLFIQRLVKVQFLRPFPVRTLASNLTVLLCLVLIGFFSTAIYAKRWVKLTALPEEISRLQILADLGDVLEREIERPSIFVAPREISDYLPGISSKSKVVFFRSRIFSLYPVDIEKIDLVFSQDETVSIGRRLNILEKYDVRYILIGDRPIMDYYALYPDLFEVRELGGYWLIELRGTGR